MFFISMWFPIFKVMRIILSNIINSSNSLGIANSRIPINSMRLFIQITTSSQFLSITACIHSLHSKKSNSLKLSILIHCNCCCQRLKNQLKRENDC